MGLVREGGVDKGSSVELERVVKAGGGMLVMGEEGRARVWEGRTPSGG